MNWSFEGEVVAFLRGPRKWAIIALALAAVIAFGFAAAFHDDFWSPLCLKAAVAFGVLVTLQVLPEVAFSRITRIVLAAIAFCLLWGASRVQEFWREALLEFGSAVGLFLALEFYLQHALDGVRTREHALARLHTFYFELMDLIRDWKGTFEEQQFEFGSGPNEPKPVNFSEDDAAHIQPAPAWQPPNVFVGSSRPSLISASTFYKVHALPNAWKRGAESGRVDNNLATAINDAATTYLVGTSPTAAHYAPVKTVQVATGEWLAARHKHVMSVRSDGTQDTDTAPTQDRNAVRLHSDSLGN